MQRSATEIQRRCESILGDSTVVRIVQESSSPNAAYQMVIQAGFGAEKAKAARWLAILRRDHPGDYERIIHNSRHVHTDTARRESCHEGDVHR